MALTAVVGLHAAALASVLVAGLFRPAPPAETVLSVSFISEAPQAAAPSPPQPAVETPPPEPTLIAAARPTASPMTAPPVEETPRPAPPQAAPQPAPQAAPAASSEPAAAAVTPPSFNAAYLNNPGPVYPYASRRKREQGTVLLRVQVSPEGAPSQVLLERSSGHGDLDKAARDVVAKSWRFVAAKQAGRAVSAWVIVPIEFSINR